MPIDNLGKTHLSESEITEISAALDLVNALLEPHAHKLTPAQRSKYGRVGKQSEMLINKTLEYHLEHPHLEAPEVDWEEFERDHADRRALFILQNRVRAIELQLLNMKVLRDYDNHSNALRDYKYSQYKNQHANVAGFEGKVASLRVFFPKTGKKKK